MARMKVIDTWSGKKGTIDEKDYDPERFSPDYNFLQKIATSKALPGIAALLGGTAAGIPGGIFGGGIGAVPAGIAGAGLSAGVMKSLQNSMRPLVGLPEAEPMQALKEQMGSAAQGVAQEAGGRAIGWAGGKILGPVLGKIKGWLPGSMKASAEAGEAQVGKEISSILDDVGNKKVDLSVTVDRLKSILKQPQVQVTPESQKVVTNLIRKLEKTTTLKPAYGMKTAAGMDIFGESGKELTKRGVVGITEKQAKQVAGEGLSEAVTKAAPELVDPMSRFGQYAGLSNQLSNPFKYHLASGLLTGAPYVMGAPALGPAGFAAGAMLMPYPRMLARKAVGGVMSSPATQTGVKALPELLRLLLGGSQYNEYQPNGTMDRNSGY